MVDFELRRLVNYDTDALLAEVRRVSNLVKGPYLTEAVFDRSAKCSSSMLRRRFGSWQQTLIAAGIPERFSGGQGGRGRKRVSFTDEELLDELRSANAKLGGRPLTIGAFQPLGRVNAETIRRRFGSWGKALQKAGLEISPLGRRYSDEDYFENLLAVWTHHGRQPKYGEMDGPPSRISSGAYEAKWGTWRRALVAFLERVKSESPEPSATHNEPKARIARQDNEPGARMHERRMVRGRPEELRQIPIGLRYRILRRDRFRCALCGTSPATDLGCELHVDHIVAFSRGGKTAFDNLRTLCARCNLGKGSLQEDLDEGRSTTG